MAFHINIQNAETHEVITVTIKLFFEKCDFFSLPLLMHVLLCQYRRKFTKLNKGLTI